MAAATDLEMPLPREGYSEFSRGWPSVVYSCIALNVAGYVVMAFSFGVFFSSISTYFGGNRTQISGLYSIFLTTAALGQPLIGWSIDRFGMRPTVVPLTIAYGVGLISLYWLEPSVLHFYVVYAIIGLTAGATGPLTHFKVAARWFDKKRGLVFGLLMAGTSSGAILVPLLTGWFIRNYGWPSAYAFWGCAVLVIILPCVLLQKESPEAGFVRNGGRNSTAPQADKVLEGVDRSVALRSSQFWILAVAMGLMFAVTLGLLGHLGPMLIDQGSTVQTAALVGSVFAAAAFVGRILGGYLIDRLFAPRIAACLFASSTVGLLLLAFVGGIPAALTAAALVGLTFGAETDVMGYLVSRYFGVKSFAEIFSYMYSIVIFFGMLGPIPLGFIHDKTGSYSLAVIAYAAISIVCTVLLMRLGPYVFGNAAKR